MMNGAQHSRPDKIRVFLSAYACEPDKGSEPGVGWRWATGLSEHVDLTVLTREGNRQSIEDAIAKTHDSPLGAVNFLYHDLAKPFLWAKRKHLLPTLAYYALWQWSVSRKYGKAADEADFVHHLTFCTLLCPGFWKLKHAKYVLGPVGAPQVNPHYFPLFGSKAWLQHLRARVLNGFLHLPWLRRLLANAAAVVPANSETRDLLIAKGIPAREVMLDTGAPDRCVAPNARSNEAGANSLRLLYAGQLERRKGLELSLRALAEFSTKTHCDWSFDLFGSGPDRDRLCTMAADLGIAHRVIFHGAVAHSELLRKFQKSDAFLFTSVRDTSGGVNLEAMAHGLPVICISHQGVGDITDASCAVRVQPGSIPETIQGLAEAITQLAHDPLRRHKMGLAGARRAREHFSWDEKFERMMEIYKAAILVADNGEPVSFQRSKSR